ncbi:SDR family NAD(P)-dependent oxidoreductase [Flavobacterium sp. PL002]|uniref:SDR family NAD(P)-dependent oxidoreductase n=1 Tax=Flavobacterium sp. PL002 TaxID=1897058 RepID=UPI001787E3BA|nr:SDR family NAD(P)-dependent oxidoreductase [Flavobacterium sp. PL002]MBE0392411.1 Rhamnolipids biosynthesis 3-oxoacyl-[acyl-carrier-protein] reductase [Flavobacterium sp. PL002]
MSVQPRKEYDLHARIGIATAKSFINAGAIVWITGRNKDKFHKTSKEINNPNLKTMVSDTSAMEGITVLEKAFAESSNKLDVLFLNLGIATFVPIALATEAGFDAQFNTNVKGAYFILQELIPHLSKRKSVLFTN